MNNGNPPRIPAVKLEKMDDPLSTSTISAEIYDGLKHDGSKEHDNCDAINGADGDNGGELNPAPPSRKSTLRLPSTTTTGFTNPSSKKKNAKKLCSHVGCTKLRRKGGVCRSHGIKPKPKKRCSHKGCASQVWRREVCTKHGGNVSLKIYEWEGRFTKKYVEKKMEQSSSLEREDNNLFGAVAQSKGGGKQGNSQQQVVEEAKVEMSVKEGGNGTNYGGSALLNNQTIPPLDSNKSQNGSSFKNAPKAPTTYYHTASDNKDDDSDDELGAMIYKSSHTAKVRAEITANEASMTYSANASKDLNDKVDLEQPPDPVSNHDEFGQKEEKYVKENDGAVHVSSSHTYRPLIHHKLVRVACNETLGSATLDSSTNTIPPQECMSETMNATMISPAPYNPYEVYFIFERERILNRSYSRKNDGEVSSYDDCSNDNLLRIKLSIERTVESQLPPLPPRFASLKSNGTKDFCDLEKTIRASWERIDSETLKWCTAVKRIINGEQCDLANSAQTSYTLRSEKQPNPNNGTKALKDAAYYARLAEKIRNYTTADNSKELSKSRADVRATMGGGTYSNTSANNADRSLWVEHNFSPWGAQYLERWDTYYDDLIDRYGKNTIYQNEAVEAKKTHAKKSDDNMAERKVARSKINNDWKPVGTDLSGTEGSYTDDSVQVKSQTNQAHGQLESNMEGRDTTLPNRDAGEDTSYDGLPAENNNGSHIQLKSPFMNNTKIAAKTPTIAHADKGGDMPSVDDAYGKNDSSYYEMRQKKKTDQVTAKIIDRLKRAIRSNSAGSSSNASSPYTTMMNNNELNERDYLKYMITEELERRKFLRWREGARVLGESRYNIHELSDESSRTHGTTPSDDGNNDSSYEMLQKKETNPGTAKIDCVKKSARSNSAGSNFTASSTSTTMISNKELDELDFPTYIPTYMIVEELKRRKNLSWRQARVLEEKRYNIHELSENSKAYGTRVGGLQNESALSTSTTTLPEKYDHPSKKPPALNLDTADRVSNRIAPQGNGAHYSGSKVEKKLISVSLEAKSALRNPLKRAVSQMLENDIQEYVPPLSLMCHPIGSAHPEQMHQHSAQRVASPPFIRSQEKTNNQMGKV